MAVLKLPVELALRANAPLAVFSLPVVLRNRAYTPLAVFWSPVVLLYSALPPLAVLLITSGVQRQRINADGRVEVPDGVTFERRETNRRIVYAAGETQKGVLAFCRVKSGIASVRWRTDRLRVLDERKADECKCD